MASMLVLALYILASSGVDVHVCLLDHDRDIIPLLEGMACESIHDHDSHHHHSECGCPEGCPDRGHEHFHAAECCDSDILVITDSQDTDETGNATFLTFTGIVHCTDAVASISDNAHTCCQSGDSSSPGNPVFKKSAARRL